MRQANFDWKLSETEPSESFLQMIRELKLSPFVGKLLWRKVTMRKGYQPILHQRNKNYMIRIDTRYG